MSEDYKPLNRSRLNPIFQTFEDTQPQAHERTSHNQEESSQNQQQNQQQHQDVVVNSLFGITIIKKS